MESGVSDLIRRFITVNREDSEGYHYSFSIPTGHIADIAACRSEDLSFTIPRITLLYERVGNSKREPGKVVYELVEVLS